MKNNARTNITKNLAEYATHWDAGTRPADPIEGIQGRFCRMKPGDATALSDDPDRRIVFLVDHKTCHASLGVPGYSVCRGIGWDHAYTVSKVNAGYRFAWVIFPESECPEGSWKNMLDLVEEMYPEVADKIRRHRGALGAMTPASLRDIEARQGWKFLDVDNAGKGDARFMTITRYRDIRAGSAQDTPEAARAFMYFTVHCKELYRGDGWTQDGRGVVQVKEYIMPAKPLAALGAHVERDVAVKIPRVQSCGRPAAGAELPPPRFFDGDNAALWGYDPKLEAVNPGEEGVADAAAVWRERYGIKPASEDQVRIAVLGIDMQYSFCHSLGSLYVAGESGDGAVVDCARFAEFTYRNLRRITSIHMTMDTHLAHQIFFTSFWRTMKVDGSFGPPPKPNTTVTTDDIAKGRLVPNPAIAQWLCNGNYPWLLAYVRHYAETLEKAGKYQLFLWPPHCIMGTTGHALNGVVLEAVMFHSYCRSVNFAPVVKGGNPLTENYSVMAPEVLVSHDGRPRAQRNTAFLKMLLNHDAVVIAGEAASHCVASSIDDILSEVQATDPKLAQRIYLLEDVMSAVVIPGGPNFTPQAQAAKKRFADHGMHLVSADAPMSQWPGLKGNI